MAYVQNALNTFGVTPFTVSTVVGDSHYLTVQDAINAAAAVATSNSVQTVIVNGQFTEDITFADYVNVVGMSSSWQSFASRLNGSHTYNSVLSGTTIEINGLELDSSSASAALTISGSAQVNLNNCSLFNFSTGDALSISSSGNCTGTNISIQVDSGNAITLSSTAGNITFINAQVSTNTGTAINSASNMGYSFNNSNLYVTGVGTLIVSSGSAGFNFTGCSLTAQAPGAKVFNLTGGGGAAQLSNIQTNDTGSIVSNAGLEFFESVVNDFYDLSNGAILIILYSPINAIGTNPVAVVHSGATAIIAYSPISISSASGFYLEAGGIGDAGVFEYNGNTIAGTSITPDPLLTSIGLSFVVGSLISQPTNSNTATTAFGTSLTAGSPLQNTSGYDILVNISVSVSSAIAATIVLGVGPTSPPATNTVIQSFTTAVAVPPLCFSAIVPHNYYLLVDTTGTITVSSITTQVCPL